MSTTPKDKHVILAVENGRLPTSITTVSGLHRMPWDQSLALLEKAGAWWGPRGVLEGDRRFRQIIPYIFLRDPATGKFLTFQRGGDIAEARLAGKLSAGVGGHIDISDISGITGETFDLARTVKLAAEREVAEETGVPYPDHQHWLGLLIDYEQPDDPMAVGHVHIGVVGVWDISPDDVLQSEDAVLIQSWKTIDEIEALGEACEGWTLWSLPTLRATFQPTMTDLMIDADAALAQIPEEAITADLKPQLVGETPEFSAQMDALAKGDPGDAPVRKREPRTKPATAE